MRSLSHVTAVRSAAVATLLAGVSACAPNPSQTPSVASALQSTPSASTPVLLSCPVGQQPLMRQVLVNGAPVPQVECVSATSVAPLPASAYGPPAPVAAPAVAPLYTSTAYQTYEPANAVPVSSRTTATPRARRAVYDDDVVEYRRPARRSVKKSAVIIGSAAGIGAGVGALTKGKKGALIGAAIGGGAATVWDQVTRRQPR